ncbi:MAG: SDR family oxidoreductase [Alphaproteobacteria bacterium]|nr:SDR family oxidoreductase [Alphaproteobacteria bacterium]TAD88539.1 MAG: SDR family oxidoreductase [Alphaproteobacteria bacterium]
MSRYARYPSLEGRVVFISGGASGIGACLVEEFCAQGAAVAFVDIDAAAGDALAQRLAQEGKRRPLPLVVDVRDIPAYQAKIAEAAAALGPIAVLINNAARDDRHKVDDVTADYWDDCLAVNLRHHLFAAQAVLPGMRQAGWGSIQNLGSVSWMRGRDGMIGYVTSKAAIHGLTRALAREVGPDNIRVNSVVPGGIVTERQNRLWRTAELDKSLLDAQCLKRRLVPEDVARMVLWLAADDSDGCTGQAFLVDGGIV